MGDRSTPPARIRARLELLRLERGAAEAAGLTGCGVYMAELEAEIAACRRALEREAITAIATLRGALVGRQVG
ncbi:MAG: hypothetical protein QOG15_1267 [Solirubrobacteraceae bacterium]|jgi:hypothetical protein|nr:hypothetical protein [Solirubrobacteraceae bacterium]